ncbi:putative Transmembrane protein [Melia azedarach]|uniref:Transmembrane protein n=1 Tax=Melia azedarach TaxID=155640 RepID=A0ACC1YE10_MELAZ|nr:putative Transmembrane protein [Melia azedarach]
MAADSKPDRARLRCHHCAGPLSMETETSEWTVPPFIRDSFSMIGSAVGGTTSAFYGFNHVMPVVRRWVKGPMWLHFLVGAPPVIVFSSACAGLAGGAVPAIAQLASSSYHAAVSSSATPSPPSQDDKMHKSRASSTL